MTRQEKRAKRYHEIKIERDESLRSDHPLGLGKRFDHMDGTFSRWIHLIHNPHRSQLAAATKHLLHANSSGTNTHKNGRSRVVGRLID